MKILAFTDVHADKRILQKLVLKSKVVDLLICCGDLSLFGSGLKESFSLLSKANKPLLFIPGNHDEGIDLRSLIQKFPFITLLHRSVKTMGPYTFVGYGGGGFALIEPDLEKFMTLFQKKHAPSDRKIVFVTHAPPHQTKLDYLPYLHSHCGCKSTTNVIKQMQPLLVLCGHFHETFHFRDHLGKTIVCNPGSDGEIIDLEFVKNKKKKKEKF